MTYLNYAEMMELKTKLFRNCFLLLVIFCSLSPAITAKGMSETCRDQSWGWYATGPGFGIQIKEGDYKGRLVIPANHSYDEPNSNVRKDPYGYGCHVLISDDHDYQLVESRCQASILNYGSYRGKSYHLFSNPAVPFGRTHMTIRISQDDCQNWSHSRLLYEGPSAYSCLVRLPNNDLGVFFEAGEKNPYETLRFITLPSKKIFHANGFICRNKCVNNS